MEEKKFSMYDAKKNIQHEKRSWLVATIVLAIGCIATLVCVIACLASKEIYLAFFSLFIFVFSLSATIYFAHTYKTRTDDDWLKNTKEKAAPKKGLEKIGIYLKPKNDINTPFSPTRTIEIIEYAGTMAKLFAANGASTKLSINNQSKTFIYQKGAYKSKTYKFSDLINYEVYENGQSQVQGRAGSALIGGAFFGLGGMIVGSSMSRNINGKCTQLQLIIRLNDFDCPQIIVNYCNNSNLDKNSAAYKSIKNNLQNVCSMLEYMLNEKTLEQSANTHSQGHVKEKSHKEQLQELKEMLDNGLIAQEDYEKKKKQILGL